MKRTLWLGALCSLALAGPAAAQGSSTGGSSGGSSGGTQGGSTTTTPQGGAYGSPDDKATPRSGSGVESGSTRDGASGSADSRPGELGSMSTNQVQGTISKLDPQGKSLTVLEGEQPTQLSLNESATVFVDGRLGTADDLQEGQQVRAAFDEANGNRTVRWIEVTTPAGSGAQSGSQGSQQGASGSMQGSMGANQMIGTIVSIDAEKNRLVLDHGGQQVTIDVRASTPIFVEGRRASLSSLQEGQEIRAALQPQQGTGGAATSRTATRIEAIPASMHDTMHPGHEMDEGMMPGGSRSPQGTGPGTSPSEP
jgi:Cu/Ag efflux protein CusF